MKSNNNYKINTKLEESFNSILDSSGHINGQQRYPICNMKLGFANAGYTSCELIAIYNAIIDSGSYIKLSQIIYDSERLGYLFAFGFLGTKASKISKLLTLYGINYEKIKVDKFLNDSFKNLIMPNSIYIAVIKTNADHLISSIHTFEMEYKNGYWTVYNRFNEDNQSSIYDSLDSILYNGRNKGKFISIYHIKEKSEAI